MGPWAMVLWAWLLGLAVGARLGTMAAGRPPGWLDWVVLAALSATSGLLLWTARARWHG
jgi:hypothetical protein